MADPSKSLEESLAALNKAYAKKLPLKWMEVAVLWQDMLKRPWRRDTFIQLYRRAHSLAGASANFGFPQISVHAKALEDCLNTLINCDTIPAGAQKEEIDRLIAALKNACFTGDSDDLSQLNNVPALNATLFSLPSTKGGKARSVLLIEDDALLAQDLTTQMGYFGYATATSTELPKPQTEILPHTPAALIIDTDTIAAADTTLACVQKFHTTHVPEIPLVILSSRGDMESRLAAVRAGGSAYFTKPVDASHLIDRLDVLTERHTPESYRVLIVDDDVSLTRYYATILEEADMEAMAIHNPLQIVQALTDFKPDLILMDLYLLGCNGLELAAVIRQDDAYLSIPIVFLSTETSIETQLDALTLGGDDFLIKPIAPHHLILSVKSRVARSRLLRNMMIRDGLTGLLNHTYMTTQLESEVARSKRYGTTLAFCVIDIDFFKQVNDTYGHPSGDRVLKSIARLLQQRLRKTDIIGRSGGEEFSIILMESTPRAALDIMNDIRRDFAQIRHQSEKGDFHVTLSAGIATFPPYDDPTLLAHAADKALYAAKQAGRNRVTLAAL